MIHIGEFEGFGGFSLAASWMNWETLVTCEINPFCQRIIKYYWPNAYHHGDIKTLTYDTINAELSKRYGPNWRNRDIILTGGFPCQPYSISGKRMGKEDDRHLWPEMFRTIREIKPEWIVGENVRGIINWNGGMVFDEVQSNLEAEGYKVLPFLLPAASVNAPHERYRTWFIAYHSNPRLESLQSEWEDRIHEIGIITDTYSTSTKNKIQTRWNLPPSKIITNSTHDRLQSSGINGVYSTKEFTKSEGLISSRISAHTDGFRLRRKSNRSGKSRYTDKISPENYWENFPTQSPVCSGNDGISSELDGITFSKWRSESIKGYGNAIVPQLAYQIFKVIDLFSLLSNNVTSQPK